MEFDDVFEHVGQFGLYQCMLYFILGLTSLSASMQNLNYNFIAAYQDHWCVVTRLENFSYETQKYVAIPYDDDGDYDHCRVYSYPFENLTNEEILLWNRSALEGYPTEDCDAWVYDQSEFVSTINSEFNLVCDKALLSQLSSTIYMLGMLVGGLGSGALSDKIGRYKTLMIGVGCNFFIGMVSPFAPGYITFVVVRFLRSVTSSAAYLCGFVLVMELLGPDYTVPLGVVFQIFFSAGFMVVTGISYAVRDWRLFQLAMAIPFVSFFLFAFVVPESPRWLISHGRIKEAEDIVRHMAAVNRRTLPDDFSLEEIEIKKNAPEKEDSSSSDSEDGEKKGSFSDICKSPLLRKELLIVYFSWFTTAFSYYALSLNASAFGDVFLNTFLSGVIEIPANLICVWCLVKGGRRYSNAVALIIGGALSLACIPVLLVNPDFDEVLTALSTLGKGAITFVFSGIYIHAAELFHTPVRQLAVGSASAFARIGSMIAPYMGLPLMEIWEPMPSVILGALAVVTGVVCFWLPETKGFPMPETVEDAEAIGRGDKSAFETPEMDKTRDKLGDVYVVGGEDDTRADRYAALENKMGQENPAFANDDKYGVPRIDLDVVEHAIRL